MDIQIENLKFRNIFQLKSWSIPSGQHILVEGPSGSGKTTLLHLISGLFLTPDAKIKIGTHNLQNLSDDERAVLRRDHFGLVFQKLSLLDHLTALENVQLSFFDSTKSRLTASEALKKLGLEEKMNSRCSTLSLGEQQRVAVARVISQESDIILADEPTSSLDDESAQIVIHSLVEAARGKTLIVVSHDHRLRSSFQKIVQFKDLVRL